MYAQQNILFFLGGLNFFSQKRKTMQKQLDNMERRLVTLSDEMEYLERESKRIKTIIRSPIFNFIKAAIKQEEENLADIIYQYLSLNYCLEHNVHVPSMALFSPECLKCHFPMRAADRRTLRTIYKFNGRLKLNYLKNGVIEVIDFCPDDQTFKQYLRELFPYQRIAMHETSTEHIEQNGLRFVMLKKSTFELSFAITTLLDCDFIGPNKLFLQLNGNNVPWLKQTL